MTNPTPATLHAWGDEWQRRKQALYRQLVASYTPEQRQIVAEMSECSRNLRRCQQRIRWPDGSTKTKPEHIIAWPDDPGNIL